MLAVLPLLPDATPEAWNDRELAHWQYLTGAGHAKRIGDGKRGKPKYQLTEIGRAAWVEVYEAVQEKRRAANPQKSKVWPSYFPEYKKEG